MAVSISDAILPDNRPFIKDLLAKHSAAVEGVRNAIQNDETCKELYDKGDNPKRYDDIWILRFVISHKGNVKAASVAALKTIRFRDEQKLNELGDIRHRLRGHGVADEENNSEPLPGFERFEKFSGENGVFITLPDKDRGIIFYIDVGKVDMHGITDVTSEEEMKEYMMFANEAVSQVLDDVTRRTGRLTKQIKIMDMGNVYYRKMSRAYIKRGAACSKALQDYYPQFLGCMYIANSPSWLSTVWSALRPFFPKRLVEKIDFLPPSSKLKKSKSFLKSLTGYVTLEHVPERYGGLNKEWPLPCAGLQFQPQSSQ